MNNGTIRLGGAVTLWRAASFFDAGKIAAEFEELCGLITGDSVTKSLVSICTKLGGISLKPSGGVYWIPDHNLGDWVCVAQAVERCPVHGACAVYLIRHSMDEDAMRAVRDGL